MIKIKSFKYRIYPNKTQQNFLARQFGASRFIYNYYLNQRKNEYMMTGKSLNYYDNAKSLTELKTRDGYDWLYEINAQSLQASLRNLETAYTNFFAKRSKFPNYKKRSNSQCIKIPQGFSIENDHLWIPKLKSGIRFRQHRLIEGKQICCFVSKTATDKYFVSIVCEVDIQPLPLSNNKIGIDVGLINLLTTSDGQTVPNPKYNKQLKKKIIFKQRQLSKKKKGSNNQNKARKIVALLHEKVANNRKDYIHKVSNKLINENQVIISETLSVVNMMKNHKLAYAIGDGSWGELFRQLEYKSNWYGKTYIKIDRFFPSSKTCNGCLFIVEKLPLDIREWDCPNCKQHNDRDINAARNIRDQGITNLDLSDVGIPLDIKQKLVEAFSSANGSKSVSKKSRRNKKPLGKGSSHDRASKLYRSTK